MKLDFFGWIHKLILSSNLTFQKLNFSSPPYCSVNDQCIEILVKQLELNDWEKTISQVVPKRKKMDAPSATAIEEERVEKDALATNENQAKIESSLTFKKKKRNSVKT